MDDSPTESTPVFSPPEPRRPAWEVALLFAGIVVFLALWAGAQWAMQTRAKYAGIRGIAETRMAERFAGVALASKGPRQKALWKRSIDTYRDALNENPTLRRARRGLAAALYLTGDKAGAKETMRGPVTFDGVSEEGLRAWEATQTAFGARPRPANAAAVQKDRNALQDPKLGWPRYVALMALAPNKTAAEAHRAELVAKYANASLIWVGGAASAALLILVPLGLYLLDRGLRLPRNRLPALRVPVATLVIGFAVALLLYQLGTGVIAGAASAIGAARGSHAITARPMGMMAALVAGGLLGLLMATGYIAGLLNRAGARISDLGWRARDAVKWAAGGYVALMPLLAAALAISAALSAAFPKIKTPQNPAVDMVTAAHGPGLVLVFVLVCVIAPVAEEMLFRGLLFRGLEKRYGLLIGALAAGMLFAGMHPQLPFGFPPVFALGVGLCYVYRISGSLVPGILMHAANNGIALTLALAATRR